VEGTDGPRRAARVTRAMWGHNMGKVQPDEGAVVGGEGIGRMNLCFTSQWERIAGLYDLGQTRSHTQRNRQFTHS
jgi:hypothetical protein